MAGAAVVAAAVSAGIEEATEAVVAAAPVVVARVVAARGEQCRRRGRTQTEQSEPAECLPTRHQALRAVECHFLCEVALQRHARDRRTAGIRWGIALYPPGRPALVPYAA